MTILASIVSVMILMVAIPFVAGILICLSSTIIGDEEDE
jgi:hypothetical protein